MYWRNKKENQELFQAAQDQGCYIIRLVTPLKTTTADLLEVAMLHCVYFNNQFVANRHIHFYIQPTRHISDETLRDCGIERGLLEKGIPAEKAFAMIDAFLESSPVLVGYCQQDIERLRSLYEQNEKPLLEQRQIFLQGVCRDVLCEANTPDMKYETVMSVLRIKQHNSLGALSSVMRLKWLTNTLSRMLWEPQKTELLHAHVYSVSFYLGLGHTTSRLYVNTSRGTIYYDTVYDKWLPKEKNSRLTSHLDMQDIENQVFKITKCKTYKELKRFKGAQRYERSS